MATRSSSIRNSTPGQSSGPRVAIVGAGLTGLIAAQGLQLKGFEVIVFDRDAHIDARLRDWTIHLLWGMATLRELLPERVFDQFPRSFCNPYLEFNEWDESIQGYNGLTGEVLFRNPTPGARRVSRRRFRKVLAEGVDIRWGKSLHQIVLRSDSVQLVFTDGDRFDADYVLGADGGSSKVRQLLMGTEAAKPVPSGFSMATCNCKYADAEKVGAIVKAHTVLSLMVGSQNIAGCGVYSVDDPSDPSTWETFWLRAWRGGPFSLRGREAIECATKDLAGICEPFRSAMQWTPPDSLCYLDEMKYWIPSPWDTHDGRVTLAGDAAHSMLPIRGQGLQHSIIDVQKYIVALTQLRDAGKTTDRNRIMAAYGADVVNRGSVTVAQSLKEAEMSLDTNTVGQMLMLTHGHGRSV